MSGTPFTICNTCSQHWETITDFIEDPEIVLLGYQADFLKVKDGVFLFAHGTCTNTLALKVYHFKYLVDGPIFTENKMGRDGCPEYCVHGEQLAPCKNICECRWVRDVMQVIRK
jgi:hypothetical protein